MLDLYYFSLVPTAQALPGLLVVPPGRKAHRHRAEERLMLLLTITGNLPLPVEDQQSLLERLAETYFNTPGTVTAVSRQVVEQLNHALWERNLRTTREGLQATALLNLAVLRGDALYLAVAGNTHSFVLGQTEVTDFAEEVTARPLGASKATTLRFFTKELQPNDLLVFCPTPPPTWNETSLANSPQLTLDHLRRRLLNQAPAGLQGVVLQMRTGNGQIHKLQPHPVAETPPIAPPAILAKIPAAAALPSTPVPIQSLPPMPPPPTAAPTQSPAAAAVPSTPAPVRLRPVQPAVQQTEASVPVTFVRRPSTPAVPVMPRWRKQVAAAWFWLRAANQKVSDGLSTLLARTIPGAGDKLPGLSPFAMLLIAIAIPLMVVAVATTVYFRTGRAEQFEVMLAKARTSAAQAIAQTDPSLKRSEWALAYQSVVQAEEYSSTQESVTLRAQAQQELDKLDLIRRLDYRPGSITPLPRSVQISRMVTNLADVYALDVTSGSVLRLFRTNQGYEWDDRFTCAPGPTKQSIVVQRMVDIITTPAEWSQLGAVVAIDEAGTLVFCAPGKTLQAFALPRPDTGWNKISAISLFQSNLAVLDIPNRRVWVYSIVVDTEPTISQPYQYLGGNDVPVLDEVVDMFLTGSNLYLLVKDGQMIQCSAGVTGSSSTRCQFPVAYTDRRPGNRLETNLFPEAQFMQFLPVTLPEPALYFLDANRTSVYQFSMQLKLQWIYIARTSGDLPTTAPTAFVVSPDRRVWLAFGNQLIAAQQP